MTGIASDTPGSAPDPALRAATTDLEALRELLIQASHGTVDPAAVKTALQTYWHDHEDTLRSTANGLTEQARLQTLDVLYKWRDQISQQRDQHPGKGLSSDPPPAH